jgi:hypothetical protein
MEAIIGQQHYLVGVSFLGVLALKVLRRDDAALQEAGDKGARPGKGVKDMDVLKWSGR